MNSEIKVGDLILLHNNKRKDRKGGRFSFAWLGLYIFSKITPKRLTTLKKRHIEIPKVKCNLLQFKLYVEEKTADNGGDTTEFSMAVDNKKPTTSVNTGTSTSLKITYWNSLPNELIEKILLFTIKKSWFQDMSNVPKLYPNVQKKLVHVTLRYLRSLK